MTKLKNILVTGSAGFIGFHLVNRLIQDGYNVVGLDNLNDYYDVNLKNKRLEVLEINKRNARTGSYVFVKGDICDQKKLKDIFEENNFDIVFNLAAQAGVRYSIDNPSTYIQSNIVGFGNILECCRDFQIKHLLYASSSSVYGMNIKQPFNTSDRTDYPISLYAATKKSNEMLAFSYSHLYKIPITGLRFFTVYGPFGRPDMAYYKFANAITNGKKIDVYNNGDMKRDFTYIDDIIEGLARIMNKIPKSVNNKDSSAKAPSRLLNIGNNNPISLMDFIYSIENAIGKKANINYLPMQPGDVPITYANIDDLIDLIDFQPNTHIKDGMREFINWFKKKDS